LTCIPNYTTQVPCVPLGHPQLGKQGAWLATPASQKQEVPAPHPQLGKHGQFPALPSSICKVFAAASFDDIGEAIAKVASVPRMTVVKRIITFENELNWVVLVRRKFE